MAASTGPSSSDDRESDRDPQEAEPKPTWQKRLEAEILTRIRDNSAPVVIVNMPRQFERSALYEMAIRDMVAAELEAKLHDPRALVKIVTN